MGRLSPESLSPWPQTLTMPKDTDPALEKLPPSPAPAPALSAGPHAEWSGQFLSFFKAFLRGRFWGRMEGAANINEPDWLGPGALRNTVEGREAAGASGLAGGRKPGLQVHALHTGPPHSSPRKQIFMVLVPLGFDLCEVGQEEVILKTGKQANRRTMHFALQSLLALFGKRPSAPPSAPLPPRMQTPAWRQFGKGKKSEQVVFA